MKRIISLLTACVFLSLALLSLSSCGYAADSNFVEIKIQNYGTVVIEVYPDVAPETVANFLSLVDQGFYDGLTFHRIYPGFMIQGGDPNGDGTGGSEPKVTGEFSENGFENNLKHERGVVSLARSSDNNSGSCQFFICLEDTESLDGNYAAFGKVVEGMDVVDAIAEYCQSNPSVYTGYSTFMSNYSNLYAYYTPDKISAYICQYCNGAVSSYYQPVIKSAKRVNR